MYNYFNKLVVLFVFNILIAAIFLLSSTLLLLQSITGLVTIQMQCLKL